MFQFLHIYVVESERDRTTIPEGTVFLKQFQFKDLSIFKEKITLTTGFFWNSLSAVAMANSQSSPFFLLAGAELPMP
jgi:hypothetical protein